MALSKKKTLNFKKNECTFCALSDKRAMRKGRKFCPIEGPEIRNGHCSSRQPIVTTVKTTKRPRKKAETETTGGTEQHAEK